jgi:hypothetical protein
VAADGAEPARVVEDQIKGSEAAHGDAADSHPFLVGAVLVRYLRDQSSIT